MWPPPRRRGSSEFFTGAGASLRGCRGHFWKEPPQTPGIREEGSPGIGDSQEGSTPLCVLDAAVLHLFRAHCGWHTLTCDVDVLLDLLMQSCFTQSADSWLACQCISIVAHVSTACCGRPPSHAIIAMPYYPDIRIASITLPWNIIMFCCGTMLI
jgi:hypothetical protein